MDDNGKIVVVYDDDTALLEMVCDQLDFLGYTVIGTSAVIHPNDLVFRRGPDLGILDIMLAGNMSGIEVAAQLRERGCTCPLIGTSASPQMAETARASGLFAVVIDKPFTVIDVQRQLDDLLHEDEPEP